jgi:hypothetical protein
MEGANKIRFSLKEKQSPLHENRATGFAKKQYFLYR